METAASSSREVKHEETIGSFLLRRLREIGLRHLFGVAGDFNLEFLDQVEEADELQGSVAATNQMPHTPLMDMPGPSVYPRS